MGTDVLAFWFHLGGRFEGYPWSSFRVALRILCY